MESFWPDEFLSVSLESSVMILVTEKPNIRIIKSTDYTLQRSNCTRQLFLYVTSLKFIGFGESVSECWIECNSGPQSCLQLVYAPTI
jgi:hypothetical protein